MTTEEHQLILEMFKQQSMYYLGLIEILKSREVLGLEDLGPFDALASASTNRELLERNILADYLRIGKTLGVNLAEPELI